MKDNECVEMSLVDKLSQYSNNTYPEFDVFSYFDDIENIDIICLEKCCTYAFIHVEKEQM